MKRPIFVDFESNKAGDIFLATMVRNRTPEQVVLHPELRPLAEDRGLPYLSPAAFAEALCREAAALDTAIAGFTLHDGKILAKLRGEAVGPYLNLARAAKRWIRSQHMDSFAAQPMYKPNSKNWTVRRRTWSLHAIATWMGAEVPAQLWLRPHDKAHQRHPAWFASDERKHG